MRNTSGILLTAAAIGLGSLGGAASVSADPIAVIGPMAPVVGVGGFSIQVPAAAPDAWRWQGPMEAAPAPVTTSAAPAYDIVCTVQTQRTRYAWRDVNACD